MIKDGLWNVIKEDTLQEPDAARKRSDVQARYSIGLLEEDNQLVHIQNAATARESWDALKSYQLKAALSSKDFILKRICRMT